jgi:hypothetical protein
MPELPEVETIARDWISASAAMSLNQSGSDDILNR